MRFPAAMLLCLAIGPEVSNTCLVGMNKHMHIKSIYYYNDSVK